MRDGVHGEESDEVEQQRDCREGQPRVMQSCRYIHEEWRVAVEIGE
jgi:hypothetical protein